MTEYRVGNHWGVTIVAEGNMPIDEHGHRPDAELVAVVVNGDQVLAESICTLLNEWDGGPGIGALKQLNRAWENRLVEAQRTIDELRAALRKDVNAELGQAEPCKAEVHSWQHFTPQQVDSYYIRCTLSGPHDEHADTGNTGLTWRADG